MDIKALFLLILAGVLANNYALTQFLGVTPFLGFSRKGEKILGMGLTVTAVTVLAVAVLWPVQNYLLLPYGLAYAQLLVFVLVIALIVALAGLAASRLFHQPLKAYAPVIALNSAVLGAAVNTAGQTYPEALAVALGVGLGFLLALYLMAGVMERIDEHHVPAPFRGLPIMLISAGILSMALLAF